MKANNFKKAVSYFALASAFTMSSCQKDELLEEQTPQVAAETAAPAANIVEGQYIVVLKNSSEKTSETINELVAANEINSTDIRDRFDGKIKGFTGRFSKSQLAELRKNPDVVTIEPEQIIALGKPTWKTSGTTTAPITTTAPTTSTTTTSTTTTTAPATSTVTPTGTTSYTALTVASGETVPAGVALVGYGNGTGKTAWIIDSGVDLNNTELNIDRARSVSFVTGVTSVQDGFGHGTFVAGIIGAKNNGTGIIGVASNATIVALRVMDDKGYGTLTAAIKAVNHVSTYGKAGDVVNMSLSAGVSTTLDNAVKTAAAKGIFFAIAAGNSGVDCSTTSPQRVNAPNVYTVSAMHIDKNFWSSSNYGSPVDRAAPGVGVYSTQKGGTYNYGTGTSFAAPHVAGLLLLKGNAITTNGTVFNDRDGNPDPVAKL